MESAASFLPRVVDSIAAVRSAGFANNELLTPSDRPTRYIMILFHPIGKCLQSRGKHWSVICWHRLQSSTPPEDYKAAVQLHDGMDLSSKSANAMNCKSTK